MNLTLEAGVPAVAVFLQGLLSFFSPCVLPLVPLYVGYLAGGTGVADENGTLRYPRKKMLFNTLFFILGVSFAFFLLGFGFTTAGQFFKGNRALFARLGGIVVILFGVYQLGVLGSSRLMQGEHRLPLRLQNLAMNPLTALLMGFTFSFAWTPCVGPALTGVLLMASSAQQATQGYLLIGVYTLGFVLPFLAVGLFTGQLLELFKKHKNLLRYTVKVGGVLMILMGIMMFTGWMNGITGYLSQFGAAGTPPPSSQTTPLPTPTAPDPTPTPPTANSKPEQPVVPAPDFTLTDQYGNSHTLSDYKGKVVFLNFWATWCGYCVKEMPDIEKLYQKYNTDGSEVVILGAASPKTAENPQSGDGTVEELTTFLAANGYSYPTLMDTTGEMFATYGITSLPTTFMIDRDGNVFGYVSGMLTPDMMEDVIRQTLEAVPAATS